MRVIAATNVKLKDAVEKRKFREDLYYRLNTVPIIVPPLRERGDDISLLFRKFSSDFSDKNNIDPVRLDEESKNLLMNYRFPGNIRELKNLTEQISILEIDRNISKETFKKYLPEKSNLPVLSNSSDNDIEENYNERDILYKILFDLKSDMNEMKKVIDSIINNSGKLHDQPKKFIEENVIEKGENIIIDKNSTVPDNQFQEVTELIDENESLKIESKEKELIIKALIKNKNKRKYAAKDLGISERTLYRKIKYYKID